MSTARTPLETAMLLDDQKGEARISPRFDQMDRGAPTGRAEDTPAYIALRRAGVLCTEHRRKDIEDIFTGLDLKQNTDQWKNIVARAKNCCCLFPCAYYACHTEMFVPAGHVGFLMDQQNRYLFAQPGMHNINSMFIRVTSEPRPLRVAAESS